MKCKKIKKKYKIILVILILISFSMSADASVYSCSGTDYECVNYNYDSSYLTYYNSWTLPIYYVSCHPNGCNDRLYRVYLSGTVTYKAYSKPYQNGCLVLATDTIGYFQNYLVLNHSYACDTLSFTRLYGYADNSKDWTYGGNIYDHLRNNTPGMFSTEALDLKYWITINYLRRRPYDFSKPPACYYILIRSDGNIQSNPYGIEKQDIEYLKTSDLNNIEPLNELDYKKVPFPYDSKKDYDKIFWLAQWIHPNCRNWTPFKDKNYSPIQKY